MQTFINNVLDYKTFLRSKYRDTVSDSDDLEDSDDECLYKHYKLLMFSFQSVVWSYGKELHEEHVCALQYTDL